MSVPTLLLLTPEQAAERLNVSHTTVREWIAEGRLPGIHPFKGERGLRIHVKHVERFADELADEADQEMQAQRIALSKNHISSIRATAAGVLRNKKTSRAG